MWDSAPSSSSVYPAERFALIVDAGTGFRLFLIGSKTERMLALMLIAFGDNEHERNPGKSCYKESCYKERRSAVGCFSWALLSTYQTFLGCASSRTKTPCASDLPTDFTYPQPSSRYLPVLYCRVF